MKYFTADLHFGHAGMLKFERPEFKNVDEHDAYIMHILQSRLKATDELWVLGDIGRMPKEFKDLPCRKYLIKGNHDKFSRYFYESNGIIIREHPIFLYDRMLLTHEPLPVTDETLCVHGHLHNSIIDLPNYWNVNIAMCNYHLISEKQLLKKMMQIPKISHEYKQEWFAPLYKYTKNLDRCISKMDKNHHLILPEILDHMHC